MAKVTVYTAAFGMSHPTPNPIFLTQATSMQRSDCADMKLFTYLASYFLSHKPVFSPCYVKGCEDRWLTCSHFRGTQSSRKARDAYKSSL